MILTDAAPAELGPLPNVEIADSRESTNRTRNILTQNTIHELTAGGGSRTLTLLPGRDFESRASASSATPALQLAIYYLLLNHK